MKNAGKRARGIGLRRVALREAPLSGRALLAQVKQVFPGRWARPRGLPDSVMTKFSLELPLQPEVEVYISPDERGYTVQVIAPNIDSESLALGRMSTVDESAMSKIMDRAGREYERLLSKNNVMAMEFSEGAARALSFM